MKAGKEVSRAIFSKKTSPGKYKPGKISKTRFTVIYFYLMQNWLGKKTYREVSWNSTKKEVKSGGRVVNCDPVFDPCRDKCDTLFTLFQLIFSKNIKFFRCLHIKYDLKKKLGRVQWCHRNSADFTVCLCLTIWNLFLQKTKQKQLDWSELSSARR